MSETHNQFDIEALRAKLAEARAKTQREFERIIQHVDGNDLDQVRLVKPEIDRVVAEFEVTIKKLVTDALIRAALVPIMDMLATSFKPAPDEPSKFYTGGIFNAKP